MAIVTVDHIESWSVAIIPGDGEEWPLIPAGGTYQMRPDLILIYLVPDQPPSVRGSGRRQRRDGSAGALRVNAPWTRLDDLPDWAAKLAAQALTDHGLPRPREHEVVPLPGSARHNRGQPVQNENLLPRRYFPVTALCGECHEPIERTSPGAAWAHTPEGN